MPYSTAQTRDRGDRDQTRNVQKLSLSIFHGPRGETKAPSPHPAHSSTFPESRHADNMPIPEEDEDETSSEPAEAITPTSDSYPVFTHHGDDGPGGFAPSAAADKPFITTTNATPPRSTTTQNMTPTTILSPVNPSPVPHHTKPHSKSIKRFFSRSHSHIVDQASSTSQSVAPPMDIEPVARRQSFRRPSFSLSATHTPMVSQSNTPPSPSSPISTLNGANEKLWEPSMLTRGARSSTGFHLKDKINFGSTTRPTRDRKRSTSVNNIQGLAEQEGASKMGPGEFFSRPAETGAGLKARRMSMSLPENLVVDSVELDKEFTSASKIPGKRGRLIGKGATATVKLMTRKGHGEEVYAVKEFRKRGQNEDADDYDKKVKSEYTIAKSLHHPNIVESVRLCTHSGRWNVVMEYCHHGELFSLVEKGYFTLEDKLCLWKQLLRGVNYLHNHGIAHRDIKLENLLLNEKGHLKITDFGVSEVFSGEHPGLREAGGQCGRNMKGVRRCAPGICGSLPYIAPEVLEKKGDYDPRPLDVWSCAIVMLTMMFQGQPWTEASRSHANYVKYASAWDKLQVDPTSSDKADPRVPASPGPMFKAISKPALKLLILRMMNPIPDKRATIQEVVKEGWVKMIDCCAHDDVDGEASQEIDASKGCKIRKMVIAKSHNHQPPEKHWAPRHNFDLGDGWS